MPIYNVLLQHLVRVKHSTVINIGYLLYIFRDDAILESFHSCRERCPEFGQVYQVTLVYRNYPIVREVLIYNFSHFSILLH